MAVPVGLIPHWRDKVPETKTLPRDVPSVDLENTDVLGGLTDAHAEAHPPSEYNQGAPTFLPKAKNGKKPSDVSIPDAFRADHSKTDAP